MILAQYTDALVLNAPIDMPTTIYDSLGIDIVVNASNDISLNSVKVRAFVFAVNAFRPVTEAEHSGHDSSAADVAGTAGERPRTQRII